MKILVIDPSAHDRESTARILGTAKHDVVSVSDPAAALAVLDHRSFDVIVVEMVTPLRNGLDVVKRLRARESNSHAYIVVTASRATPGDAGEAFQIGADDFLRKPASRDELLARVDGINRVRKWALRLFTPTTIEEPDQNPAALDAWRALDVSVCAEVADLVGYPISAMAMEWKVDDATHFAQIGIQLPAEGYEVIISVAIDAAAQRVLGEKLFGNLEVGEIETADMLREICNTAASAFKRGAATQGKTFTLGIPADVTAATMRSEHATERRRWIADSEHGVLLRFEAEIRSTNKEFLPAAALREGMVLAHDLKNASGALLLRGGTRLTRTQVVHLEKVIGPRGLVEVSIAA